MAVNLTGAWTINSSLGNHAIDFMALPDGTFQGTYTDIPDPSVFTAQILSSTRGTLLNMIQQHPQFQYIAVYTAVLTPLNVFQGVLVDVDANRVDFQLGISSP